ALLPFLRASRWRAAAAVAVVVVLTAPYYLDYAFVYPVRGGRAFEAGEIEAITHAHNIAGGHTVLLFSSAQDPSILALFALRPRPGLTDPLPAVGVRRLSRPSELASAQDGDVIVLAAGDPPPAGATLLFTELAPGSGRLMEAARIELASEAASRKNSTSVVPVLTLTCPTPVGPDSARPVAELSPPDGRDARRERVSGVYAGRRSC